MQVCLSLYILLLGNWKANQVRCMQRNQNCNLKSCLKPCNIDAASLTSPHHRAHKHRLHLG
ncbi:hypothetical protein GYH30_006153 [Glycine max]|nr:hypothetical protein GYH30_006153 [Glycine max]